MKRLHLAVAASVAAFTFADVASAAPFSYSPSGQLVTGSGKGRPDTKVYAPSMRFPMEKGPAFANSQVWGNGGNEGPAGTSQCDAVNFSYPWRDNYCESRDWEMPLCPSGSGHQGQDIRAADCKKDVHWVVAAVDGTITNVGSYSVYLTAADGTRYDYLHMSNVQVKTGDKVTREQRIGKVSNQFGGAATTVHLHFNIRQNVAGLGSVYVPTYMSLVSSYEYLLGLRSDDAGAPDAEPAPPPPPKEVQEIPVTVPEEPAPPPFVEELESGCTFAGPKGRTSGTWLAGLLAITALARRAAKRRG